MLILIAILLALVPAVAILYPFLRMNGEIISLDHDVSTKAELARRWDTAVFGLRNTELEMTLGNLTEQDYLWLMDLYKTDAALVMKAMELEEQEEAELLEGIDRDIRYAKERILGNDELEHNSWPQNE